MKIEEDGDVKVEASTEEKSLTGAEGKSIEDEGSRPSMLSMIISGELKPAFWFIVGCEFCERFCYYGVRAVLTLYLKEFLSLSNSAATSIYHMFTVLAYFTPILGAIVADAWLGKFKTILTFSIVFGIGSVLMAILAIPSVGKRNPAGTIICLIIMAFGTGGMKPCISSFGADQFVGKERQLEFFFNVFYIVINCGSVLSMIISPIIKGVRCFAPASDPECKLQSCNCYLLSFGIPAIFMIFSSILIAAGSRTFVKNPPAGSTLAKFIQAIYSACVNRLRKIQPVRTVKHWLDYASAKFDNSLLNDFKQVLAVTVLFIPLCFFWTLFDQTGSTWVLQGSYMNQKLGSWVATPDIVQAANPILVILLVPVFDSVIYPLFAKCGLLTKALHRMIFGMVVLALAFVVTGVLQVLIVKNPVPQTNNTLALTLMQRTNLIALRNELPCPLVVTFQNGRNEIVLAQQAIIVHHDSLINSKLSSNCTAATKDLGYFIHTGSLLIREGMAKTIDVEMFREAEFPSVRKSELTPSTVSIAWQLFSYLLLSAGEVAFSISGLHFSYAEAPASMKSVMTAIWLLTNSIGNMITLIINAAAGEENLEAWIFFLYAALLVVIAVIFAIFVRFYVPYEKRLMKQQVMEMEEDNSVEVITNKEVNVSGDEDSQ